MYPWGYRPREINHKLEPGTDLVTPANFAAIAAAVEWCHHEWHRVTEPLSAEDQEGWIAAFVVRVAADAGLFAHTVKVADFLALGDLLAVLLRSFGKGGGDGIDLLVATKNEVPQLASMLCEPLRFADGAAAGAFLEKVATGSAGELTYEELELCDGLYFRESMKEDLCLGLTAWTAAERARRQTTIDAEVEAHKVRRAAVPDLSVEEKEELARKLRHWLTDEGYEVCASPDDVHAAIDAQYLRL